MIERNLIRFVGLNGEVAKRFHFENEISFMMLIKDGSSIYTDRIIIVN